jgi:hypothetical protein
VPEKSEPTSPQCRNTKIVSTWAEMDNTFHSHDKN